MVNRLSTSFKNLRFGMCCPQSTSQVINNEAGVSSPDIQTFSVRGSRREQDKSSWDEEKLSS